LKGGKNLPKEPIKKNSGENIGGSIKSGKKKKSEKKKGGPRSQKGGWMTNNTD